MASGYENTRAHKAQAAFGRAGRALAHGDRPTAENAEESALENCQIFYGQPCVLLAVDGIVQPNPSGDSWPRRDMARVGYAGTFDPERIPGVAPGIRERTDILKYRSAPAPKAVAMTPRGDRMFTRRRRREPARRRGGGAETVQCRTGPPPEHRMFLYAAADRVVLALRLTAPLSRSGDAPPPPARPPPPPRPSARHYRRGGRAAARCASGAAGFDGAGPPGEGARGGGAGL